MVWREWQLNASVCVTVNVSVTSCIAKENACLKEKGMPAGYTKKVCPTWKTKTRWVLGTVTSYIKFVARNVIFWSPAFCKKTEVSVCRCTTLIKIVVVVPRIAVCRWRDDLGDHKEKHKLKMMQVWLKQVKGMLESQMWCK